MTPAETLDAAREWLDEKYPLYGGKHAHRHIPDAVIARVMENLYPTGLAGFMEDMAQAHAVS